jgi:hypothetical protein
MKYFLAILVAFSMVSCELLNEAEDGLTEAEVVSGLKSALSVGTDNAVSFLSVENGYYGNELYKILLPEEAQVIVNNVSKIPGGQGLVDDVIKGINRAAEDAAKDAGPIFLESITDMSITDGWNILNGDNHAATTYLKNTTNDGLFNLYSPKINASLGKDLLGSGISVTTAWSQLTSAWNSFVAVNNAIPFVTKYNAVNTDLGGYLTQKALDGMYLKISKEEELIRKDPMARVNDILQKVFGSLD